MVSGAADKLAVFRVDGDRRALGDLAGEDRAGQERFDAALQIPPQRPRAVERRAEEDRLVETV